MEITIIKETMLKNDKVWYKVAIDGIFSEVFNSYEEAEIYAFKLMDNGGKQAKEEVVKTIKIKLPC
jgi:hypothetical protein